MSNFNNYKQFLIEKCKIYKEECNKNENKMQMAYNKVLNNINKRNLTMFQKHFSQKNTNTNNSFSIVKKCNCNDNYATLQHKYDALNSKFFTEMCEKRALEKELNNYKKQAKESDFYKNLFE